ncbi:hypothetical protein [Paenibacillus sp. GYB003]|uniref:hypothetical protein n=1 Tax=Paenibacillus sp. GYB003 TaxID=2994392 RepID=UPI002F96E530
MGELIVRLAGFVFIGIVLFFYYLSQAIHTPANSDYAAIILEAKSILEGNIFLSGWHLSTVSYYTTEIPIYVIGIILFGFNHNLLYIVPCCIYTLTVAAALWVVYNKEQSKGTFAAFCLLGIPVGLFCLVLTGPIHIVAICFSIVCIKLLQYAQQNKVFYLYFGLLFCWTLIGDTIALWVIGIPVVLAGIYRIYLNPRQWKGEIIPPLIIVASVVVSKVTLKLISTLGGFSVPGTGDAMFAELAVMGRNIYSTTYGLLEMFNANFFGKPIGSLQTMKLLLHFGGMLLVLYIVGIFVYQMFKKKEIDYINQILSISVFITISSYLISNMNLGTDTSRYLIPVVIFGGILVGRHFNSFTWTLQKQRLYIAGIILYAVSMLSPISFQRAPNQFDRVIPLLQSHGLKYGYASYWLASPITLFSNGDIQVRQVIAPSETMQPYEFLSDKEWYDAPANFVIFDKSGWGSVHRNSAVKAFGEPFKELTFEDMTILVWDKDISPYLKK